MTIDGKLEKYRKLHIKLRSDFKTVESKSKQLLKEYEQSREEYLLLAFKINSLTDAVDLLERNKPKVSGKLEIPPIKSSDVEDIVKLQKIVKKQRSLRKILKPLISNENYDKTSSHYPGLASLYPLQEQVPFLFKELPMKGKFHRQNKSNENKRPTPSEESLEPPKKKKRTAESGVRDEFPGETEGSYTDNNDEDTTIYE